MSDVRNLRAMFEQQAKAPPPVAAKPMRDRSKTIELQRKLEAKAETELPSRPPPIKLPVAQPTAPTATLPSPPASAPSNGNQHTSRIIPRSISEPARSTTTVSTAANDKPSSATSAAESAAAIPDSKSAPATPRPPVVKPKPTLTRSNSVGNGIRQRLNTLGALSFNPMAGPRPTKPKSPVADRSDKNDNAIPGPNNPDRVFQRSNTMGSLAEIQRQQSQEAKAVPVLALDQAKIANANQAYNELPAHSLLGTNEGRARVRLGSVGARQRRLPSRKSSRSGTGNPGAVPVAGAVTAPPKAEPRREDDNDDIADNVDNADNADNREMEDSGQSKSSAPKKPKEETDA